MSDSNFRKKCRIRVQGPKPIQNDMQHGYIREPVKNRYIYRWKSIYRSVFVKKLQKSFMLRIINIEWAISQNKSCKVVLSSLCTGNRPNTFRSSLRNWLRSLLQHHWENSWSMGCQHSTPDPKLVSAVLHNRVQGVMRNPQIKFRFFSDQISCYFGLYN